MNRRILILAKALVIINLICIPLKGQDIIISEFMALNDSVIQDEDGDFSDWIEIYNSSTQQVNLGGWSITDDSQNLSKWVFPSITITANEYLVVFASSKDRNSEKDKLHTNFRLSSSGEYLALVKPGGTQKASEFSPSYPEQYKNISYGGYMGSYVYFNEASPGSANINNLYLPAPKFSIEHGYYFNPFLLSLTSDYDDVDIYYTTDASTPDTINGIKYSNPITISTTTVIRAIAVDQKKTISITKTQTYIFINDVLTQPNNPPGYPSEWGAYTAKEGYAIADYEMDSEIVNDPDYNSLMIESLTDLPIVSIVSDIDNFFSKSSHPDSGGLYIYTGAPLPNTSLTYDLGHEWIRPGSVELFNLEEEEIDFQLNCGIKIHGGHSRRPEKCPKHSFKVTFQKKYGPTKLNQQLFGESSPEQYDWLILRGGFNNTWLHSSTGQRKKGQHLGDPWAKTCMREMGHYSGYSRFVHLYLNGLYWGMFNLSERMDDNCMRDNLGGEAEDYDLMKDYGELGAGTTDAWDAMVTMAGDNIEDNENYQKIQGNNPDGTPNPEYEKYVDAENLIDYMILNFYGGNTDWDHHNWAAARSRVNSEGYQFLIWDAEQVLTSINNNVLDENNNNRPSGIFKDLMNNVDFQMLFVDRVYKHFFNGGVFTPEVCIERYKKWASIVDTAVISESARWGDYRRDVHQNGTGFVDLYTKSDYWDVEYNRLVNDYFPNRTRIVLNQFIRAGMYPSIEPPTFNTNKDTVPHGFELIINASNGEDIYYTLNNSDPRAIGGTVSESANSYNNESVVLTEDVIITARAKSNDTWSASVTKELVVSEDDIFISVNQNSFESNNFFNYPNPFSDYTRISYSLAKSSDISITIYNMVGMHISMLDQGFKLAGDHTITWETDDMPPGLYICIFENNTSKLKYRIKLLKE